MRVRGWLLLRSVKNTAGGGARGGHCNAAQPGSENGAETGASALRPHGPKSHKECARFRPSSAQGKGAAAQWNAQCANQNKLRGKQSKASKGL
jgi:hypothetical protein